MDTLFLCIPSGTPAANLLRTAVFPTVRDDPSVERIVILSPYASDAHFRDELQGPKIDFAELAPGVPGWLERRFIRVMQEKFVKTMPTESMRIRIARAEMLERAQQKEIRILAWSHFVPAYDKWLDQWTDEWSSKSGVKAVIDHVPHLQIPAKIAAEVATQSGHDIVQLVGSGAERSRNQRNRTW